MVALSLFALIGAGGIAFDYAHMAAMDTELQNAADQAALAAATQLDGSTAARARADAAAQSLIVNNTLFASDSSGDSNAPRKVVVSATYYQSYNSADDTYGAAADSDANAKVVKITVTARRADFALTPVTASILSATIGAEAVASLGGGAICKVPPLMICNPTETNANLTFDPDTYKGRGLKLEAGGGGQWTPGNYGYLDFGNGANTVEQAIGANAGNEPCVSADTVATKPGNTASAPAGINTRFDIFENGLIAYCAASTGNCSPAINVIKDAIHPQFNSGTPPNEVAQVSGGNGNGNGNADNCAFANGSGPWSLPTKQYLPVHPSGSTDVVQDTAIGTPGSMGSPRDKCHAVSSSGDCTSGRFGDGSWDRDLYFQVNYGTTVTGWQSLSWLSSWASANGVTLATISRYNVYRAEVAAIQGGTLLNAGGVDAKRRLAETQTNGNGNGNGNGNSTNYYAYANARCAAGQAATQTVKDRRVLTAAVVNCTAGNVQGSSAIAPIGWIDLFLVEPSLNRPRTGQDQIYVEIIGGATRPDGGNAFQYYLKQRPRLLK